MALLSGIHPVAEALRAGNPIERIVIAQGAGGPRLQEIIDLARRAHVPVRFEPRSSLDRLASSAAHQGVVALGAPLADPIIGLVITLVILRITWESWHTVREGPA